MNIDQLLLVGICYLSDVPERCQFFSVLSNPAIEVEEWIVDVFLCLCVLYSVRQLDHALW